PRARAAPMQSEFRLADRFDKRGDDGYVARQAARHHRGDRDLLSRDAPPPDRLDTDDVAIVEQSRVEELTDQRLSRRYDRQSVRPAVFLKQFLRRVSVRHLR